jgi:hypothetical protein
MELEKDAAVTKVQALARGKRARQHYQEEVTLDKPFLNDP